MKKKMTVDCADCDNVGNSLFCELEQSELSSLDTHKTSNIYKKGQVIFYEGNRPLGLYCLQSGKVKVYKTGVEGKEQIVRFAKPGELLGYRALIGEESYTASAAAMEDCQICLIDSTVFFNLIRNNPDFSWKMMQSLSRELRQAEDYMTDMAQKSVRERVAEVLILLKARFGLDDDGVLSTGLSREELASFVGTATETLIRLLSELKVEGVIATKGQKIKILKPDVLLEIANIDH